MMSKREDVYKLIGDLRYQLASGVHTYGKCMTCDEVARGSGLCSMCVTKELGLLVGRRNAEELLWNTKQVMNVISNIEDTLNE